MLKLLPEQASHSSLPAVEGFHCHTWPVGRNSTHCAEYNSSRQLNRISARISLSKEPVIPALPTGTITFLFTDIQGSTQHWERSPDTMRRALARHDQLLRRSIEASYGHVFKTGGDAFCAAFAAAPDALEAALAAQLALTTEPWETDAPLLVRMALHTGTAEERNGDYFGSALSRVARLLAVGHGGQTLLSAAAQELTRDHCPPAASLRDLGLRRLKDLGRPETVFQLLHPDLPVDFPLLKSLDNPALPNNLPQQTTSFIGRETEMAEVKSLLGKARLVTLTGAGGSGKSRLSLQVAADLLLGDGDGVWLVELAPLTDAATVTQTVADVLGVREEAGKPIARSLVDALKDKRLLLILDNCEHLVAACASLAADLLRSCPHVSLFASSREALGVVGEQTYRIPSLSMPDLKQAQTVESVSQYEAVRLFIERARLVQPAFTVSNANAPAVSQICFQLDGIPLALELAAARVRSLSIEEINSRLDNRFRLLTGGPRTVLPRQQTLRALIDWSYDLLTEQEKALLCRLSVFAGGWTLSAAEAVCADERIEEWEVLDLLTGLVDKSLIVYDEASGGVGRARLLETVRQYALDRLGESGEGDTAQERAASWFLAFAEEAQPQLMGPEQAVWLRRLETEHDNLRASLSWYEQAEDPEQGLRLVGALCRFWGVRGHYHEGRQRLDTALKKKQNGADEPEVAEEANESLARAKACFGAGYLAYGQGDFGVTQALYQQSLTIYRRVQNQTGITTMLDNLGNVAYELGDYTGARDLYEESLALARRADFSRGIASSLGNLGNVSHELGDYGAARGLHEECLSIQRQLGDQRGIANSLNNLGNAAHELGDYTGARDLHEASLTIQRQLGNQRGIANSLFNLGNVSYELGDAGAARDLYGEGLVIRRRLGDKGGIATSLDGLAKLAYGQNQGSRAVQLFGAVSSLCETTGIPLTPVIQENMNKTVASLREALGAEAFAGASDAGRTMTVDEAVDYALEKGN